MMMEAQQASEACSFNQNGTMGNVQYMCEFNSMASSQTFRLIRKFSLTVINQMTFQINKSI
jgi:hypothetical protein